MKAALVQTTNTAGYVYIKQMADNVVQNAIQAAIDADNEANATALRWKAKSLKDGFRALFAAIETTKQFGSDSEPEWFSQLAFEADYVGEEEQ